ncbi:hypothetical protein [Alteribacillus sp. HJP-4]|uniref:hypothetical protein n=1 Tax=Alteribacillus sp. HJP-4 TaxID=2775394 RepID=UPI0035CD1524
MTNPKDKKEQKRREEDMPPSAHEDPIPLEDMKHEEKEIRKKHKSKNTSSSEPKKEKDKK